MNGDFGRGLPNRRLQSTQPMDTEYEMPPEPDRRPTMLLKAALLPRLRRDRIMVIVSETMMATKGMGVPTTVILRSVMLNGIPWSRANAKTCRDAAARTLRLPQMLRAVTSDVMAIVPPVLPTAA